jgi:hypothetical protein
MYSMPTKYTVPGPDLLHPYMAVAQDGGLATHATWNDRWTHFLGMTRCHNPKHYYMPSQLDSIQAQLIRLYVKGYYLMSHD